MERPTDHAGLIDALGGGAKVAEGLSDLPQPPKAVTVRAWAARNRIPPEYWPDIIRLSVEAGCPVNADWLMQTTPSRQRPGSADEPAASDTATDSDSPPSADNFPFGGSTEAEQAAAA